MLALRSVYSCTCSTNSRLYFTNLLQVHMPFSLQSGMLMRAVLFEGKEASTLALTFHHIAVDLWSLVVILAELKRSYEGDETVNETLPYHYGHYAWWQHKYIASVAGSQDLAFWKKELGDSYMVLI